jgi:hypothetical protein
MVFRLSPTDESRAPIFPDLVSGCKSPGRHRGSVRKACRDQGIGLQSFFSSPSLIPQRFYENDMDDPEANPEDALALTAYLTTLRGQTGD